MKNIYLRLDCCRDRESLHDVIAAVFSFPSWYGRNLDALYDLLTDISEDTCVCISAPGQDLPSDVRKALTVFSDAADDNPHLRLAIDRGEGL